MKIARISNSIAAGLAATLVLSHMLQAADLSPAETKAIAEQLTN
jgi:hypothetical protein